MSKDMGVSDGGKGRASPASQDHATHEPSPSVSALRVGIVDADVPEGAIETQEEFVAEVRANGRLMKTTVFYVVHGPRHSPFKPFMEEREYIWPLKIRDRYGQPFVADVRGQENSFGDMLPNGYNLNFAFFDREDADAYISAASRIEARSDQTPQAAEPEGREPDPAKQGDAQ